MTKYVEHVKKAFIFKYPIDTLYPSEIGICLRRSYFYRHEEFRRNIDTIFMDLGEQYHRHVEDYFVTNLKCQSEISANGEIDGIKISARIDLLCDKDLIELKTTSYNVNSIKDYHLLQIALYYYLLQKNNIEINNIYVIYMNRNSQDIIEIQVSKSVILQYLDKAMTFIKSYKKYMNETNYKNIPGANNYFCKNCEFINKCYGKLF